MEWISCRTPLIPHRDLCICSHTHQPFCSCSLLSHFQCKNKLPHCPMYSGYKPPGVTDLSQRLHLDPATPLHCFCCSSMECNMDAWPGVMEMSSQLSFLTEQTAKQRVLSIQAHISIRFHKTSSLWIHSKSHVEKPHIFCRRYKLLSGSSRFFFSLRAFENTRPFYLPFENTLARYLWETASRLCFIPFTSLWDLLNCMAEIHFIACLYLVYRAWLFLIRYKIQCWTVIIFCSLVIVSL